MAFIEMGAVIVTAGVVSLLVYRLKQPLIIAYILTGLLIGPNLLAEAGSAHMFESLSEIGIAFLLFLVGLNLHWQQAKDVGKIAIIGGLGQVLFTTLAGFGIALLLGFHAQTALLLGLAFALSSTIVIVKLLSDKEDLDRFYGRISIGILLIQDLVAMITLLVISSLGAESGSLTGAITFVLLKGAAVLFLLYLAAKWILPHLMRYAARNQELLFLVAISWCFALASVLHLIGFGIEIGALLAGVSLASTGFQSEINSRVRPLRDFFLIIFFIILGTQLTFSDITGFIDESIIFSLFVLIGNPIILLLILRAFGYHPRAGFLTGVTLAQISEFSFIILAAAVSVGLVAPAIVSMATLVAIITITLSTYLISYNELLYDKLEFLFSWMGVGKIEKRKRKSPASEVLLFGYQGMGETLLPAIKKMTKNYTVADFNPVLQAELSEKGIPNVYGDVGNEEFLDSIQAGKAKLIVSTIPDIQINQDILSYKKSRKSKVKVVVTVKKTSDVAKMYEMGAMFVIVPNMLSGEHFSQLLTRKKLNASSWSTAKKKQLAGAK